jgi:hypothetical protein
MARAFFRVELSQNGRLHEFVRVFLWFRLCEIWCPLGALKESYFFCTNYDTDPGIFLDKDWRQIGDENVPYVLKPYGDEVLCDHIQELILAWDIQVPDSPVFKWNK